MEYDDVSKKNMHGHILCMHRNCMVYADDMNHACPCMDIHWHESHSWEWKPTVDF